MRILCDRLHPMELRSCSSWTKRGKNAGSVACSHASDRGRRIRAVHGLQVEPADTELIEPDMVGELVAHRADHLVAEQLRAVPEVASERVSEDHDAIVDVIAATLAPLVQAIRPTPASAVGDHDRDVG